MAITTGQGSGDQPSDARAGSEASTVEGRLAPSEKTVVGFVLYPGATLLDFAGATQVFGFAGMQNLWLARRKQPVETTEGVSVVPTHTFDDHPPISILFVPGGGADGVIAAMFDPVLQRFLVESAKAAAWSGSVCTGAFILAAAGLLEGCKTTTYWSQIPNLKTLAEKGNFEVDEGYPRYLIDRARRRFTGGGVSSSIDLALELVATVTGSTAAAAAAQLSIQYAPDPPVKAGDPCEAPPELAKQIEKDQQDDFILPIQKAVRQLLAGMS